MATYPSLSDDNFSEKITKKFKKYEIENKKPSFKSICNPKEYKLQPQQIFVSKYINPSTPYKSLLLFHQIGAGKTCAAIRIGEEWRGHRNIIVILPASLIGNFRNELRSQCANENYITKNERKQLKNLHPSSKEYLEIIKKSDDRIDKYYKIYSYNTFITNSKFISFKNSILIIDEVQNMISETGTYYKTLYETILNAPNDLRMILLSATPMFDRPVEIALTLNLFRPKIPFPISKEFNKTFIDITTKKNGNIVLKAKNIDLFKSMIKGYISYYKGAPSYTFPQEILKIVKCQMSDFQYGTYLTAIKKDSKKDKMNKNIMAIKSGDILSLPQTFYLGARMVSNISFPNKKINDDGYKSLIEKNVLNGNLKIYSIKFAKIINYISKSAGPTFVYSNFKGYGGIKSFVKVLKIFGYKNYEKYGEGKKRFVLWTGDISTAKREEYKNVYNQSSNINGSKIKIMLGSPSIKEGVSLLNVKQIHILEPYWNYSGMLQTIGRGIRYCSHKMLEKDDRFTNVYIYLATHCDEKETVDQHIFKLAKLKNKIIEEFELAMKESAVDCNIFKYGNKIAGDDNIVCD